MRALNIDGKLLQPFTKAECSLFLSFVLLLHLNLLALVLLFLLFLYFPFLFKMAHHKMRDAMAGG